MRDYLMLLMCLAALQLCSCTPKGDAAKTVPQREKKSVPPANTVSAPDPSAATHHVSNPYAGIPDNEPVIHRVRAGELNEDGWCLAESTRGRFSVMLPGQFVDTMIKAPTPTGGTGIMHTVATRNADGVEFNVLHSELIGELPAGSPVDGMIERFKKLGATLTKTDMIFADLPAVRMRVTAPGVTAEIIHVDAPAGNYMLSVQARPPQPDNPKLKADIERFFLSFRIAAKEQ